MGAGVHTRERVSVHVILCFFSHMTATQPNFALCSVIAPPESRT
jgi:hypothetical protein